MNQNKNNLKNYQEQVLGKIKEIDDIKKEINYQSIIDILHNLNNDLKKLKEGHNSSLKKDLLNDQEIINFEKKIKKLEQKKAKNQAKFTNLNNKQKELFKIFNKNENVIIKNKREIAFISEEIYKLKDKLNFLNDLEKLVNDYKDSVAIENEKIKKLKEDLKAIPKNNQIKKYYIKEDIRKAKKQKLNLHKSKKFTSNYKNKIRKLQDKLKNYQDFKNKIKNENKFYQKLNQRIDNTLNTSIDKKVDDKYSFDVKNLNVWYDQKHALYDVDIKIPKNKIIAIIGPSGCGKSTFLRTLNRINDNIPKFRMHGKIIFDDEYDIYKLRSIYNHYKKIDLTDLRTKIGMIFQQPNPFPMSIRKNVAFSLKISGFKDRALTEKLVKKALKKANLWDEVKSNLKAIATSLSGGQQQRLCIARAIIQQPEVLLMDEPTSALDPKSSAAIENLILELKKNYTIIIVTHSMQQAQRVSDYTAFFYQGRLIEFARTEELFNNPKEQETKNYLKGKFG
ncbi:phosphate ABC transporter ATP-binding protein PstB [Candidatus Hepatoplasma crinochetorum]|uniref:Phosphate import ATP-binding protein PstB 3 n=1 Tax=Candidatus Hepatoplasma crinochetorum Av TaxID=1427984 RepID=W8GFX6_9MOLU|nr:phosphate ABC transporter ATP-binding protein PstB [Candidatus Hepatoplasma crinochetorum]AHK22473.1 Phosphate import ATP-binding protein PstB 3 [Candidatus Hepatoplasma crinochetorum Av]BDV03062.1 MAG: hypothetical protein HCTKY_3560 [Candidatus Hepatoplasma crinochetorum]